MDQAVRNKLRNVVTQCRKALEDATAQALQGHFGIYAARKKGEVHIEEESRMGHLSDEDCACRQDLIEHLDHIRAIGCKPREALDQLVREIAFTHLNRLCAYKMMEARGLIREAVSRGVKSQGFIFYLADHPNDEKLHKTGQQDAAYRNFLDWLGGTLSEEIGVLFNPNDPANRIYPPQRVLDEVLGLINGEDLNGIWTEDETIGWVYQYFTPKELRNQARKESQAPRNSYELAFRNQFFTPRYVVEFLTDNTLGRIWYEMRKGETSLRDRCRYLVRRPKEIFLKDGQEPPAEAKETRDDLSQEELLMQPVHIPHRPKKDPREIRVLDPACGSGHFLLYCFDLLQIIYEEAYDDQDLGVALKKNYPTLDDLRRAMPALILKNNLHGIDIDLRATQIAALALWLRCQRAYQELGLKNGERDKITRSNIVCAEPMPGETDLLKEFTAPLQPKVLGQLVEVVFEKMKLAGEAGSLLKIEEEIKDTVTEARKQWLEGPKAEQQLLFLPGIADRRPKQQELRFDVKEVTGERFWEQAEDRILEALKDYAERVENGRAVRRRLFAEDATRGFAFIDLFRKRYDVVLMNPPFGEPSAATVEYLEANYPTWNQNLLCAFLERGRNINSNYGATAAIFDRTAIVKSTYKDFRRRILIPDDRITAFADLGWEVLDANVEVTSCVLSKMPSLAGGLFFDVRNIPSVDKGERLVVLIANAWIGLVQEDVAVELSARFGNLPNAVIGYDFPAFLRRAFSRFPSLEASGFKAYQGHALRADKHFRVWWEIAVKDGPTFSQRLFNGAGYSPYHTALLNCVIAPCTLESLPKDSATVLRNTSFHGIPGVCFGKRGDFFCAHALPAGHVFTVEGQAIPMKRLDRTFEVLGFLNAPLVRFSLNKYCGQHKYSGYVNLLPFITLDAAAEVSEKVRGTIESGATARQFDEVQPLFFPKVATTTLAEYADEMCDLIRDAVSTALKCEEFCHQQSLFAFRVTPPEQELIEEFRKRQPLPESPIEDNAFGDDCRWFSAHTWVSISLGCTFGRWDIRFATGERQPPELPDPFDALPVCPPGMLQGPDGLPAKPEDVPTDYPIRIDWDGILTDDPEHEDDIVRRVRDVLEVIWKGRAEAIEKEACEILAMRELRDYFRKPGNGGFWMDHVKRYSKSRRKAPIYWYLRSVKGNYGLWLYYHRLDKDILFKALLNYVEPKIRLEEDRLNALRARKEAAGSSGREAKQIEKEMDRQEQFVSELHDFKDKLRRAADLHLTPDLNDGVVLNIAPLRELVPWKEAQKYWEELSEGKYEWSSIGKRLGEKELVRP